MTDCQHDVPHDHAPFYASAELVDAPPTAPAAPLFQPVATAPAKTADEALSAPSPRTRSVISQAKRVGRLGRMALRAFHRASALEDKVDDMLPRRPRGDDGRAAADAAYKAEIDAVGGVMAYRLDDPIIVAAHERAFAASKVAIAPFDAAQNAWNAERKRLLQETGQKAAEQRQARLDKRLEDAGYRLLQMPPRTIEECTAVAAAAKAAAETGLGSSAGWTNALYESVTHTVACLQRAALPADAELLALGAELERLWGAEEEAAQGDDATADAAVDRTRAIVDVIMARQPTTLAGAKVRARAVAWGFNGEISQGAGTGSKLLHRFLSDMGALDAVPFRKPAEEMVPNVEAA